MRSAGSLVAGLALGLLLLLALPLAALAQQPAGGAAGTPPPTESPWYHLDADGSPVVDLWFGYSTTCPHCRAAAPDVQAMDDELPWLEVHWLQVNAADSAPDIAFLDGLARSVDSEFRAVPIFLFAEQAATGWDSEGTTGQRIRRSAEAYHERLVALAEGSTDPLASAGPTPAPDTQVSLPLVGEVDASTVSLPILAGVLGGLDSLNPCALSVLLFLMSVLAGTRDRRRMAIIGGTFVAVTGLVYFVLMAAWLNLFLVIGAQQVVTVIAGLAAVAAALINLKDFAWFRRGISLTLPEQAKPSIFGRILDISEQTKLRAMLLTTILVAAVANTYEMLCTGGFPVVFTRVLTLQDLPTLAYYGYIALYCLVYVLPAALIVLGFTLTLGSRGVSVREARALKLLSGLLMLGFGLLLLLAPDLLTDMTATITLFGGALLAWVAILLLARTTGRAAPHPAG